MAQSQRWCFTLNNYEDEDQERICQLLAGPDVKYGVYGREVGQQGTPHLQGFVIFRTRLRFRGVLDAFATRTIHVEPARATSVQAADYCKKDGDYEEFGTPPTPGKRTEFEELKTWVMCQASKPTRDAIAREFPILFLKYSRIMEWVEAIYPKPRLEDGTARDWQLRLENRLNRTPDDRRIVFVIDPEGGAGKSWFVRYWYTHHPEETQLLGVGKRDDLAHAIKPDKRYFFFDVPRSQLEYFQYSILEQLKNRMIFSPKYSSHVKVMQHVPHVVVFTNEDPDMTKLTPDRYKLIRINRINN